ncbi:SIMPL domain-containing protein [Nannocystis sp.]|uniref:SIMPL domain-containing protein n=1 Tax=Nannocystis sp. TaxID=1962667 RepID=UPI0024245BBA|nr:SIMPL domain-containing protein [Nannocystis sp.]MBK7829919.1 SIMPL domain-containing protein [Nannocystis sp.]MBK9757813.1 SIMPL domain-containing protein [Nannocystis sp.]
MKPSRSPDLRPLGALSLAVAMVIATFVAASTWERVRVRPEARSIEITGSAKKRIVSDLIEWSATIEASAPDRLVAYKQLREHSARAQEFLTTRGVPAQEIFASSAAVDPVYTTEYIGTGDDRIARQVLSGYLARQSVVVRSTNVTLVEKMSREITELLEQGIIITSSAPLYHYTKLGEMKIEMLAEASKDARTRAENMVNSAGGASLGKLRSADMGVININPANVTQGSWDGNNDTTSLEKDIITIIHARYELE